MIRAELQVECSDCGERDTFPLHSATRDFNFGADIWLTVGFLEDRGWRFAISDTCPACTSKHDRAVDKLNRV